MDEDIKPTFRTSKYEWLRSHAQLDLMDMDEQVMQMPVLLQEAGECTALANEIRERAKDTLKHTAASLAHALREDKSNGKRSESTIEASVPIYPEYINKLTELSTARLDASLWEALTDALRSKSMAIRVAADMLTSGWITADYIRNKRRREIREAPIPAH